MITFVFSEEDESMKRKLISRNKKLISNKLKLKKIKFGSYRIGSSPTFDEIDKIKKRGQSIYQRRLARQQKLNSRQLKKLRQRQQRSGLGLSKFGGMCKIQLKPASAVFRA